ncbi:PilZ domain-containing protein [Alkalimarinus alittae]|uniref:PilZ domain-containing protein n=1 Tax=Alkalimarinus alittae TaxID=2961619 RepID=A0ABY6N0W8_9ALTE|nr:PilZ domain-containing protein [Alkalimarinus alittae]UZE95685.1 PilZ domain-containing protein [Alkalimarinus alittae]
MNNTERRTHHRYLAPSLSISLKSIEPQADNINSIQLSMVDFNCFGMAVESQHNFKIGEELQVIISDKLNQSVDVDCFVCNRAKTADGYRSGLYFMHQGENIVASRQLLMSMEQQFDKVV